MYGLNGTMHFLHPFLLSKLLQSWKCSNAPLVNYGTMRKTEKGEKEET